MKIYCSAEATKVMEHTGCLECALGGKQECGMTYPVLKAIFTTESENGYRNGEIHVSDVNGCLLKAYYTKTEPQPFLPNERLVLMIGIAVHDYIQKKMDGDVHYQSEFPVHDIVDGRIDLVGRNEIVDLKTTRWLIPDRLPYGNHASQVNLYAVMYNRLLEQLHRVRAKTDRQKADEEYGENAVKKVGIQYIDVSGPTQCRKCQRAYRRVNGQLVCPSCGGISTNGHLGAHFLQVEMEPEDRVLEDLELRAEILRTALAGGVPPEPEPSVLCRYCPFAQCPEYEK